MLHLQDKVSGGQEQKDAAAKKFAEITAGTWVGQKHTHLS